MGELAPYNCPDCNGVLWRIEDGPLVRFRCHTGHAYSSTSLASKQDETLERSLYDLLRSLRERAILLRDIAEREPQNREHFLRRADAYDQDADTIESLILSRGPKAA